MDTTEVVKELIDAAIPFTDGSIVDETGGTIPLMDRLERAIAAAKQMLEDATPPRELPI